MSWGGSCWDWINGKVSAETPYPPSSSSPRDNSREPTTRGKPSPGCSAGAGLDPLPTSPLIHDSVSNKSLHSSSSSSSSPRDNSGELTTRGKLSGDPQPTTKALTKDPPIINGKSLIFYTFFPHCNHLDLC